MHIILGVIGGLFGLVFLIGIGRCVLSYGRVPRQDRVSGFIHRYQLQREMEDIERNQSMANRNSLFEPPPPPYIPPPPSYDAEREALMPLTSDHDGSAATQSSATAYTGVPTAVNADYSRMIRPSLHSSHYSTTSIPSIHLQR